MLYYSFILDGVEVGDPLGAGSGYVLSNTSIELTRLNNSGDSAEIYLSPFVDNIKVPVVGQSIIISRGLNTAYDDYKFRGYVVDIKFLNNQYKVLCKNYLHSLKYKLLTISYDKNTDPQAGVYSEIFKDIVERGGFNASVVSSGSGDDSVIADKFISNKKSYLNRLNLISTILNWYFYQDYNNDWIRLEPKGYVEYLTTLNVGTNIVNIPFWETNFESVRNNITVEGYFEEDTSILSLTGDGVSTTFFFNHTPLVTECYVNDVKMVRGVPGVTEDYDYYVDIDKKQFIFIIAPADGHSINMSYTHKILSSVQGKDIESINAYNIEQEEAYRFDDILTTNDAERRLQQMLQALSSPIIRTTIHSIYRDILPGMKVIINDDNKTDYNGNYIVERVKIIYPQDFDVIDIGIPRFRPQEVLDMIRERLDALKGSGLDANEIIRHLIQLVRSIVFVRDKLSGEKRDKGNSLIFDDLDTEFDDGVSLLDWQGDAWSNFLEEEY